MSPAFGLVAAILGILVGAYLIRLATRLAAGFTPAFRMALMAAAASYLLSLLVGEGLQIASGQAQRVPDVGSICLILAIGFLIQAAVYYVVLRDPLGNRLSLGKACAISGVQMAIVAAIGMVLGIILLATGAMAGS